MDAAICDTGTTLLESTGARVVPYQRYDKNATTIFRKCRITKDTYKCGIHRSTYILPIFCVLPESST